MFRKIERAIKERAVINCVVEEINSKPTENYTIELRGNADGMFLLKLIKAVRENCKHIKGCRVTEESITFVNVAEPKA